MVTKEIGQQNSNILIDMTERLVEPRESPMTSLLVILEHNLARGEKQNTDRNKLQLNFPSNWFIFGSQILCLILTHLAVLSKEIARFCTLFPSRPIRKRAGRSIIYHRSSATCPTTTGEGGNIGNDVSAMSSRRSYCCESGKMQPRSLGNSIALVRCRYGMVFDEWLAHPVKFKLAGTKESAN